MNQTFESYLQNPTESNAFQCTLLQVSVRKKACNDCKQWVWIYVCCGIEQNILLFSFHFVKNWCNLLILFMFAQNNNKNI